ncbi:MAG TPA: ABC-F family ATP-binding cassette domain-containing protein [Pyrinomonadaceae bacterium]|nr:ABC-F family ATP-binding cassette domain-containing protein [Chloracidobacterium sp.]MBP9936082.1 ABC-F family ATP-binding cassette domain-containing protein [Pyrinomonadaceae bacterium]MBK7803649.1 ABC-F family ATP-binding cassette domain-containing protein [Chloracidobacterium sp.]MBL0239050.1 ABC-F family ATP-binding cassette domain-containing protein [Chloracidobacterium sp.]HQX55837.1 ABC-F family ATP-binding cassette domain-containing protein [Pyrinomonadaceae bacterium]
MLFRINNAWKSYGGNEILKGVSFQVNPSEKVGLVGRNGAGKTTVFRLITGQEAPDEGEVIKMNGLTLGLLDQHVDFGNAETVHTAALSAFKEIHDIEAEMRQLEKQMETDHSDAVLERYADLQTAFEHADGFSYAARAEAVLLGMGFPSEKWADDVRTLSGGQKNRLGMVRLLLSNSDVLLLDEPTNHLDTDAVEWLEEFLKSYDKTYVVVSHDRYFLDRTTNRVIEIDRGVAVTYKGNYSKYLEERELRREQQLREYENQQALINKTQEFIRRNLEGQKTKQAKSRRTLLARMDRIEAVTSEKSGGNFGLRQVERTGNNVLTAEDLTIGYENKVLATKLNFSLHRGDALGIIGGNGTGKTTLIKTILGNIRELDGKIHWGTKTNIGYYSQNLEGLEPRNEVVQELRRVAPMADNNTLRGFLAKFLFLGEDVFKPVSALSGGEKGRLALAKLIYSQKNVLILDEPTNHLDIPSRESLENALEEYDGTIIVVSHDRFFLDKIASQMLSFEPDGRVLDFAGNYTEFHDWKLNSTPAISAAVSKNGNAGRSQSSESSTTSTLSKNQRNELEKRIRVIETEIPALELEASKLTSTIALPKVAADYGKLAEATEKLTTIEARIQALYDEWSVAADQLR